MSMISEKKFLVLTTFRPLETLLRQLLCFRLLTKVFSKWFGNFCSSSCPKNTLICPWSCSSASSFIWCRFFISKKRVGCTPPQAVGTEKLLLVEDKFLLEPFFWILAYFRLFCATLTKIFRFSNKNTMAYSLNFWSHKFR